MIDRQSYRESHQQRGNEYEDSFSRIPHRRMMWQMERRVLDETYERLFAKRKPGDFLDFACGTGRVLSHFADRFATATGIDVSASMLDVAQQNVPNASFIEADLTRGDVIQGKQFDLITAFRFFPNAEASLRLETISALERHLKPNGILILNNHENLGSSVRRLASLLGREIPGGMGRHEIVSLVTKVGLEIAEEHPLGFLPATEKMGPKLIQLVAVVEPLFGHFPRASEIARNIIYVCRRQAVS